MSSYKHHLLFGKHNFVLMLLGVVIIGTGYLLMSGGASADPNVYAEAEIYSFRRITLAPLVVLLGFGVEMYAIFYRSGEAPVYADETQTAKAIGTNLKTQSGKTVADIRKNIKK